MKKTIFLFTMILVVILLVSCNQSNEINNSSETYEEQTTEVTESAETTELTETSEHTETTEVIETGEDVTTDGELPDPFPMIALYSFDEIIEFINLCNSSEVEFQEYIDFHYPEDKHPYVTPSERLFTYEHAQEMYDNVIENSIILPKDGVVCDDYGIAYYPDDDKLIESFLIGDVRYQFTYWYSDKVLNYSNNSDIFECEPEFKDVMFGDNIIDLYEDYYAYSSYITINGAVLRVSVFTEESTISFDDFNFSFGIAEYLEANTPTE